MRIQHNIMAMNAYRNYTNNVSAMKSNLEKLSSGYKINRAGDDAAGLAISEKMRAQITGLQQAQNNAKSGINLVQTAEGALQEVQDMLNRMVKLAEQSANGTYDDSVDRNQLQKEFEKLTNEIDRIADSANFNGIKLLDGSLAGSPSTNNNTVPATVSNVTMGGNTVTPSKAKTTEFEKGTLSGDIKDASGTPTGAAKDDEIKVKVTIATAPVGAEGAGATDSALEDISISDDGTNGSKLNDYTVTFATGATAGAVIDDTAKTITITLDETKNDYKTADLTGLIAAAKDGSGSTYTGGALDNSKITITAANDINATGGVSGSIEMSGGADNGDAIVELTVGSTTKSTTVASGDWTGNSKAVSVGGMTITFDAANITSTMASAEKIGTIKEVEDPNAAETLDLSAGGWTDGDSIKIDGKTYTYSATADGTDGETFKDLATLAAAAAVNDVTLDVSDATNVTATKTTTTTTGGGLNLQIGDTAHAYNRIVVNINSIKSTALVDMDTQNKLDAAGAGAEVEDNNGNSVNAAKTLSQIKVDSEENAREALGALKGMVNYISDIRGELGATQNRLDHTINNLSVMTENIQDAESTIRDTDVADEMMAYTKNNILIQSAQAMLAQANQVPQGVLQLLQ